jgi:hypothetical protein
VQRARRRSGEVCSASRRNTPSRSLSRVKAVAFGRAEADKRRARSRPISVLELFVSSFCSCSEARRSPRRCEPSAGLPHAARSPEGEHGIGGRPQARSPRRGEHLRVGAASAEREGFEPSVRLPVHMISSHAPSATRSPLPGHGALCRSSARRAWRREWDSNPRYPHGYT